MQLNCPHCGNLVTSEDINIQEMVAVCSNCDNIFSFEIPETQVKQKRRKVHQPPHIIVRETETQVSLSFRTNFRLDKNDAFLTSLMLGVLFAMMTTLTTGALINEGTLFTIPLLLLFGIVSMIAFYRLALVVYNQTVIDMDDESISMSRQPLPSLANLTNRISTHNIKSIYSEESDISKKEAYDTPRYHVWAEMTDGNRKVIVKDVIEDYGAFIAQYLNENLHQFDDDLEMVNTNRLVEKDFDDIAVYSAESQATTNNKENYQL